MSGDLISRSAFIKAIHSFIEQHRNGDEVQWTGYDWLLKEDSVINIVNNLPTAYDADKAVEQLKESKSGLTTWAEDEAYKLGIEKAIDMIKAGGVNG